MNEQVRERIINFFSKNDRMPSYSELAKLLGYASKNAAYKVVEQLVESGFVRKDKTGKLLPGQTFSGVHLLGLVEAGFPSAAEEELTDTMNLDEYLIENKEATFMLQVKGDSMKDAGIVEGDMVLVERKNSARPGDIVIAEVDGEWTMKYYRIRGKKVYLEAANKRYKPIHPVDELKISAVVTAVIRKYR